MRGKGKVEEEENKPEGGAWNKVLQTLVLGGYDTFCRSLLSLKDFDTVLFSSVSLLVGWRRWYRC